MEKQPQNSTDTTQTTFTSETRFYAQPYDISAGGFFFSDAEDWKAKQKACRNDFGQAVEEFEIQFIDGDDLDCQLFEALSVTQATIEPFIDQLDKWDEDEKKRLIVAVGECGYLFDITDGDPDQYDVDLYTDMTLSDLAYQFIDEGLFGEIPQPIANYIDHDAIARDLAHDYTEITIAGETCVYRCA
jgi:antirestriction protein